MRRSLGLLGGFLLAGCASQPTPADLAGTEAADGYVHYRGSGTFRCDGRPVALDGNHTDVTLRGECSRVVMRGAHNDVAIDTAPGAVLEITGTSNDVTWRQVRPGPRPVLRNLGTRNDFHHGLPD